MAKIYFFGLVLSAKLVKKVWFLAQYSCHFFSISCEFLSGCIPHGGCPQFLRALKGMPICYGLALLVGVRGVRAAGDAHDQEHHSVDEEQSADQPPDVEPVGQARGANLLLFAGVGGLERIWGVGHRGPF